ncbi:MAG: MerR family transcriptional regulator [Alphaproteobacteria bacterium]
MAREESHNGADRGLRTVKAPGAFRTISEVAGEIDVPQHVLRFWETKFNQVKPLKRAGGRRYYRPEDVALLGRIRGLLYEEGYTIKGVQKLLRSGGLKALEQPGESGPSEAAEAGRDAGEPQPAARPEAASAEPSHEVDRMRAELKSLRRELAALRDMLRDKSRR